MTLAAFREHRSLQKRRAILDAATTLFASQGITAVSMATLAAQAGVSTATLYRHFEAKEDVFACVIDELVHGFDTSSINSAEQHFDGLHLLALRYARTLVDPTVLGLLRAVVADPDQGSGFRERLASHGNAIFLNDFDREIRAAFNENPQANEHETTTHASLELRGALEHVSLVPGLLFHETPNGESLTRQVGRIMERWRRHWLGA